MKTIIGTISILINGIKTCFKSCRDYNVIMDEVDKYICYGNEKTN